MSLLDIKHLTVKYNNFEVLHDVSFSLEEGETLAILGPNGAGKSTILKAILGLADYKGSITWSKKVRIGFVPQRFDFDKSVPMTVLEFMLLHISSNIKFWFPKKSSIEDIKKYLNYVGAEKFIDKNIGELSSGEFQRVLIARALSNKPDIMLFDEPTADIDVEGEMTIYPLLKKLSKELSFALLLVSHDLNVVFDFADKVICLNKKKMCSGAPKAVLTPEQLNQLYGEGVGFYVHEGHGHPH